LDAKRSAWANFLLGNFGFAGWLLWTNNPSDAATLAGGLVGTFAAHFGLCGGFGWIVSSVGWRLCKKSRIATTAGFVLGAAGIFSLVALGNTSTAPPSIAGREARHGFDLANHQRNGTPHSLMDGSFATAGKPCVTCARPQSLRRA
jgi:hypothetical protein